MTTPAPNDLLARLRAADELYAEVAPDPKLEARLGARLRGLAGKPPRVAWSSSLRGLGRPLALVLTCAAVLFLSLDDDTPPVRSGLVAPNQTEFAADPDAAPAADHAPETNPRVVGPRRAPAPSAPDARPVAPSPSWRVQDPSSPSDADPERGPLEHPRRGPRPDVPPGPRSRMHTPGEAGDADDAEGFVFWSPTQALSGESRAPMYGATGGARGSTTSTPKPPGPVVEPPGPLASCATPETWKGRAELDCDENGLVLAEITYLDPCGDGLFRSAEHECAEPDPEVDVCTTDTVGDGATCQDPSLLKDMASQACQLAGQQMVDFQYTTGDCGGMTRQASYTCCPPIVDPPPPEPPPSEPPPLVCQSGALGDGVTCLDNGLLKDMAYAACKELGLSLADLQIAGDCPAGQASKVGFSCCGP
ncbi:hypothetical protein [Polyangium fumosum]|uniref:Uncharacterized protein n=1 Tax=Polyangium fumosum TaxID=889272 RepID=A0A4U1IEN8_9BACT|nr:hypothetical protein [Polyangium fumosum]TKC92097.1 hypothetical protein E8A74_50465 [Polyangium fumosum]